MYKTYFVDAKIHFVCVYSCMYWHVMQTYSLKEIAFRRSAIDLLWGTREIRGWFKCINVCVCTFWKAFNLALGMACTRHTAGVFLKLIFVYGLLNAVNAKRKFYTWWVVDIKRPWLYPSGVCTLILIVRHKLWINNNI